MPGRGHSKSWWRGYEKLRKKGASKTSAAKIINAAKTKKRVSRNKKKKK